MSFFRSTSLFFCILLFFSCGAFGQTTLKVSKIEVTGNVSAEETGILFNSGLSEGMTLSEDRHEIATAIRNIYSMGFFDDVRIEGEASPSGDLKLRVTVKELPKLDKLVLQGNKKIKKDKLEKAVGLVPGQFISPGREQRAKNQILDLYTKEGYLLTEVSLKLGEATPKGRQPLIAKVDEGPRVQLRGVHFYGNQAVAASKLQKQMKNTKPKGFLRGGDFKEEDFQGDLRKVVDYYRKSGYRDAYVVSDSLYYDATKKDLFIDITVEEGPLYHFGKITWSGNKILDDKEMASLVVAQQGQVYSQEQFDKSREQVQAQYSNIGHIAAQVAPKETVRGDTIDIHFNIEEKDPSKIRMVTIAGNSKTKDRVIRRELVIRPGQTFSRALLERSLRNVNLLNYFNNVEPEVIPNEDLSQIDVTLKVEEKSTGTASVGAGFSGQGGLVGTIGLSIPNFLGNGQLLSFSWEFGTRLSQFQVGFTEPWLFNTPTSLSGSVYRTAQRYIESEFDIQSIGASAQVGRRLRWPDDYSRASIGYGISQTRFVNFTNDSLRVNRPPQLRDNLTSRVSLNFTRDSRDLPQFATTGSVFSSNSMLAGGILGGNINYYRHSLDNSFYFPLFWKVALSFKQQVGLIAGFGGSTSPFNERFTPGGIDMVDGTVLRGYEDRSVGPRDASGLVGGRAMLIYNLEASFPVVKNQVYFIAFADAGNSWEHIGELSLVDLRRSAGFGVRIFAPVVGILGFDFGWGFDRSRVDGQPVQMITHFQFGPQQF